MIVTYNIIEFTMLINILNMDFPKFVYFFKLKGIGVHYLSENRHFKTS